MFVDYRMVAMMFKRHALKQVGLVHGLGVSHPVIRNVDGKYQLAAFTYVTWMEGYEKGTIPRPDHWIALDLISAELVKTYDCAETDFAEEPADTALALTEAEATLAPDVFMTVYEMLDVVRKKYDDTHVIDTVAYNAYMEKLLSVVPEVLRPYYSELSNI